MANTKAVGAAMRTALQNKHAELYASLRRSSGVVVAPQVDAAQPAPVPAGHAGTFATQVLPPAPPGMNDWMRQARYGRPSPGDNGIILITR